MPLKLRAGEQEKREESGGNSSKAIENPSKLEPERDGKMRVRQRRMWGRDGKARKERQRKSAKKRNEQCRA